MHFKDELLEKNKEGKKRNVPNNNLLSCVQDAEVSFVRKYGIPYNSPRAFDPVTGNLNGYVRLFVAASFIHIYFEYFLFILFCFFN